MGTVSVEHQATRRSPGPAAFELLRAIPERNAARDFLIDANTKRTLTYGAFCERARAIASDLLARGVCRGERVGLLLHNSIELAELYFACLYAGFVAVPINPALSREEVEHIVKSVEPKAIFASSSTITLLTELLDVLPSAVRLIVGQISEEQRSTHNFIAWNIELLSADANFVPFAGATVDDAALIMFTSGTTARPRGVVHSLSSLVNNGGLFIAELGLDSQSRFYSMFAMTYMAGFYNLLLVPFLAEASLVVAEAFNARSAIRFWDPIIACGINTLWLPPTAIAILLEIDRGTAGADYCRKNMRLAMTATAPLPLQLRRQFEERYGIRLYESYGLSELLFICTNAPNRLTLDHSVGRPLPGIDVKIVDDDGRLLPLGEQGEIHVSSPHVMRGYFDSDTNVATGPFPTGDIGLVSESGDLIITGRKKDLIIRGGMNISPAGIEDVIYRHPSVRECAVVGVPHHLHGEEPAVAVRLAANCHFDQIQAELIELCRKDISAQKRPAHIIELQEFPHSSTGKIQKNQVRSILMARLGLSAVSNEQPSRVPMIPGRVRRTFPRLAPEIVSALGKYPTGIISDCMNRLGMLDSRIRPIATQRPFCGSALTVEEVEAGNMMSHAALELIQPGDVLVIDAKGTTTRSAFGGLQLMSAKRNGATGVVVYGTVRDHNDIVKLGLPVYALGTSPGGPMKGWGGNINYPIACAGVVVNPGDIVIGDDDGVVVVPRELAEELPTLCEQRLAIEEKWFAKVKQGESTLDAVNLRVQLDRLGIRYD